jgi:hypothetical protein
MDSIRVRLAKARDADVDVVLKLPPDELRIIFYPKTAEELPDWQLDLSGCMTVGEGWFLRLPTRLQP